MILPCQATRNDGQILCIKRDASCFNTYVTEDMCQRCAVGETVQPVPTLVDTLPPFKEGRDRKVRIEPDGTILYEEDAAWPEPPKDITGYERDPNNPLRFISKWLPCFYRASNSVRFANCGCLGIISRCNNPAAPNFVDRVDDVICNACQERVEK